MASHDIYADISRRTNGDIYIGAFDIIGLKVMSLSKQEGFKL